MKLSHSFAAPGPAEEVWEALLAIPSGSVTTYSEIARRVGNPKAMRAVGTAVGRNPISFVDRTFNCLICADCTVNWLVA